jgi:hypothetical protein
MFDALLSQLETDLRAALGTCVTGLVSTARARFEGAHSDVAKERAQGLVEVAEERAKALAEVDARCADLGREVAAMHTHREAQEGRVKLNIGGYRFETSVQTLRRVPHTFFDAYFSGRYAQDVCNDGSIFVDRDGEHFGHVLEYMRDGVVPVAEVDAKSSVSLLRALKREFGFYCMELSIEGSAEPEQSELAFLMGGLAHHGGTLSSMERYDVASGEWSPASAMNIAREGFGVCAFAGQIYVIGGLGDEDHSLLSVEKYSPSSDTWSAVAPLPESRSRCAAVSVGSAIYVLGGGMVEYLNITASVLKFDGVHNVWSEVAPMPEAMAYFAACTLGIDIYVFGGLRAGEEQPSVFKYNTEANAWSVLAPMPVAMYDHCVSVLNGLMYIVGLDENGRVLLRFDPVSGEWAALTSPLAGCDCGASFVLGNYLYTAGGLSSQSTVERYDAVTDTWTAVARMLKGRNSFGAVMIGPTGNIEKEDLFDSLIAKSIRERH